MSLIADKDSLLSDSSEKVKSNKSNSHGLALFKWFSEKFQAGSVHGSTFELISATIGAGVLTLPYALGKSGLTLGIIQAVICAALGYYSTSLLAKCGEMAKKYSYTELAMATYGPAFQFFVKTVFFLNNWGGCVIYTILITNLIGTSFSIFFPNLPDFLTDTDSYVWPPLYTTLIILPLSLYRNLSALRYACLAGFGFIMYLVFVIVYQSDKVADLKHNFQMADQFIWDGVKLTFPPLVFSYSCHANVLDVYHELRRPTIERMNVVLFRTMFVAAVVFIVVGAFGYLTFVDHIPYLNCPKNILLSFSYVNWPTSTVLAVLCIGVTINLAMPLGIKPSKDSLRDLIVFEKTEKVERQKDEEESGLKDSLLSETDDGSHAHQKKESMLLHISLVVFVVYSQMFVAMFAKSMERVITLLGASAFPLISYNFPCMFYLKLDKSPWYSPHRLFCHFINFTMFLLAIYCTYAFFIDSDDCKA
jgi:Amino acid permeases